MKKQTSRIVELKSTGPIPAFESTQLSKLTFPRYLIAHDLDLISGAERPEKPNPTYPFSLGADHCAVPAAPFPSEELKKMKDGGFVLYGFGPIA